MSKGPWFTLWSISIDSLRNFFSSAKFGLFLTLTFLIHFARLPVSSKLNLPQLLQKVANWIAGGSLKSIVASNYNMPSKIFSRLSWMKLIRIYRVCRLQGTNKLSNKKSIKSTYVIAITNNLLKTGFIEIQIYFQLIFPQKHSLHLRHSI